MRSLPPESDNNGAPFEPGGDSPSFLATPVTERHRRKPERPADLQPLIRKWAVRDLFQKRTMTDLLIEALTPFAIFVMVYAVISFLLDVRYVYLGLNRADRIQAMYETTLRSSTFFFVMGVVALNRLIARDGKDESILYIIGLVGAVGFYTLMTTDQTGSLANNFMNQPPLAAAFNMTLVGVVWWVTNRLTHECCVDENPTAGEIGILTGTVRRVRNALAKASLPTGIKKPKEEPMILMMELEPVDPSQWKKPAPPKPAAAQAPTKRLPKRHPGVSVLYASIPAMLIFAIGQHVLQNGDVDLALQAHVRIAAYTVSALSLLMLASLGGLREYFRQRNTRIPAGIGPFWIGLGIAMVAIVVVGASQMPMPKLPPLTNLVTSPAYNQLNTSKGERSETKNTSTAKDKSEPDQQPKPPDRAPKPRPPETTADAIAIRYPNVTRYLDVAQRVVLVFMAILGAYAVLRGAGALALALSRRAGKMPGLLRRIFAALDRFLQAVLRVPSLPGIHLPRRVSREVALSTRYANPLADPILSKQMSAREIVEYTYTALCALAQDLAVPRRVDQTPFEFIRSFPKPLDTLRDDALKLTNLYVVSAYSPATLDERDLDTVRGFWRTFQEVRRVVIR
jgi:hypothetical protein